MDNQPTTSRPLARPAGLVVGEDPEQNAERFRRAAPGVCLMTRP